MNHPTLTRRPAVANHSRMDQREEQQGRMTGPGGRRLVARRKAAGGRPARLWVLSGLCLSLTGALSGCITVSAPDKPIVIELNINIKQEVIYRLAADAGKTIDSNKEIF